MAHLLTASRSATVDWERRNWHLPASLRLQWPQRCRNGWRFGAFNFAIATASVFFLNLFATCYLTFRSKSDVLYEGNCDRAEIINSGLHMAINAISAVLLSGSNYCMQCLSAPTRTEIDRRHSKRKSLDIGILSVRNLRHISKKRVVVWCLLGFSSVPLHLFYNSAVFMSLAAYQYTTTAVTQSLVDQLACLDCNLPEAPGFLTNKNMSDFRQLLINGRLERLENLDCINSYGVMLQTQRGNVLLVTEDDGVPLNNLPENNATAAMAFWSHTPTFGSNFGIDRRRNSRVFQWICSSLPDPDTACDTAIERVRANASNWAIETTCISGTTDLRISNCGFRDKMRRPISYCLSHKIDQKCKVRTNQMMTILVTMLNLLKAGLMFFTALGVVEEPLMSMGDAVASFLEQEDIATSESTSPFDQASPSQPHPKIMSQKPGLRRSRWLHATSLRRRILTFSPLIASVVTVTYFNDLGLSKLDRGQHKSLEALYHFGFGALDPRTAILFPVYSILENTLIANASQVAASAIYMAYNSLFTCMLLSYEWTSYMHAEKGLRVSGLPRGEQRSSYFLSLPYRFAVPLMGLSSLVHWLVSQGIFFVAIETYLFETGPTRQGVVYTCGYWPIAMIWVIITGILMLVAGVGVGFVPYRRGAALVGSCSAAMSAACHPPPGTARKSPDISLAKVRLEEVGIRPDGTPHYAFTSSSEIESATDEKKSSLTVTVSPVASDISSV